MQWPRLRFTVRRLMLAVAVVGVLLWAWLYRREHGDIERSLTSNRLHAFAEGDAVHRRMAVEDLAGTRPDDLLRVLPSLAAAAADDDWRTRLAAVHSAGSAARRWTDERQRDEGEEISRTKHLLIRAFDDPRGEVRLEALRYFELLSGAVLPWTTKPPPATPAKADPQLVASLIRLMSDRVPEVRAAAVSAFARIRWESGEGADPVIGVMMRDPEARVRIGGGAGPRNGLARCRPTLSPVARPAPGGERSPGAVHDRLGVQHAAGPAAGIGPGAARCPGTRRRPAESNHPDRPLEARPGRPPRPARAGEASGPRVHRTPWREHARDDGGGHDRPGLGRGPGTDRPADGHAADFARVLPAGAGREGARPVWTLGRGGRPLPAGGPEE